MKRMINILFVLLCLTGGLQAQDKKEGKKGNPDHEKMRAEMVAFFTAELDLTPAEAEKFWPVFNEAKDRQREHFQASHQAYKALCRGIKEGKTGAEIAALTDAYVQAQAASNQVFTDFLPKFRQVLPEEKVARIFMAEEKFRRQQIHRLRPGDGGKNAPDGERRGKHRS